MNCYGRCDRCGKCLTEVLCRCQACIYAAMEKVKSPPNWRIVDCSWLKIQWQFELGDFWIGLFYRKTKIACHFYVCLIPCFPLHITKLRKEYRK